MFPRHSLVLAGNRIYAAFKAAVARMDKSLNPRDTIRRLQNHTFALSDLVYLIHIVNSAFWLVIMRVPGFSSLRCLSQPISSHFFLLNSSQTTADLAYTFLYCQLSNRSFSEPTSPISSPATHTP